MRIEAITVCASAAPGKPSYDDFLAVIARHNRGLIDRWIVCTTPWDKATQEVARKWDLELLISEEATRNGRFEKGRLISRAQRLLAVDSWRLHIDSDIVLPTTFRNALVSPDLDTRKIYGADRVMCHTYEEWEALLNSGYLGHQHDYHCRTIFPLGVEVGSRWVATREGYCPIGYFQLWHADADEAVSFQRKAYPIHHGEASRTDTQHPLQWDRRERELLPEVIVVHLESEKSPMGTNWDGRKTRRFGPAAPKKETPARDAEQAAPEETGYHHPPRPPHHHPWPWPWKEEDVIE